MKKFITLLFVSIAYLSLAQVKSIDTQKSTLNWKGYKVVGSHEGTLNFLSGELEFKKNTLIGGKFVVDMQSISSTDMSGKGKERLDGHLKSEDFFDSENHPKANLIFTKVEKATNNSYKVTADLTIKGITKSVSFLLSVDKSQATAHLEIDRIQYDIKYRSGSLFPELADKAIKDNFDLDVILVY